MRDLINAVIYIVYKYAIKPILFLFDPEIVHDITVRLGECLGQYKLIRTLFSSIFSNTDPIIGQSLFGINFVLPIGLAAGFDYEARLTQILPSLGFGFGTVGTITSGSYGGNDYPRLGRLVKSKSLLVNKGFKNLGIKATLEKVKDLKFDYPVGISIGKTNALNSLMTQEEAVQDILSTFRKIESSSAPFSYYELNISCPNLSGIVTFYDPEKLRQLLAEINRLNISKPIFIKMPITLTSNETIALLDTIAKFPIAGVIIGNLHKNRNDPSLIPEEVAMCGPGSFSGKPAEKRSNELIRLAYTRFGDKLIIIGCGGVFNAKDTYQKIRLGSSLVQLITGLVYEGPQLVSQINRELAFMLHKDGYNSIVDAVGVDA